VNAELKMKMRLWREGLAPMPGEYIDLHRGLAEAALEEMRKRGVVVHRAWLADQGWLDGFRCLHAVVELPKNRLLKLQWHDSGTRGYFMQACTGSGGWFSFDLDKELAR
jgi:hypothetical protein